MVYPQKSVILIASEEAADRRAVRHLLPQESIDEVFEAEDVESALKFCQACKIDYILLDVNLAGASAADFLEEMNEQYHRSFWPVILVSRRGSERSVIEAFKFGAHEHIEFETMTALSLSRTISRAVHKFAKTQQGGAKIFSLQKENEELLKTNATLRNKLEKQSVELVEANQRILDEIQKSMRSL